MHLRNDATHWLNSYGNQEPQVLGTKFVKRFELGNEVGCEVGDHLRGWVLTLLGRFREGLRERECLGDRPAFDQM